MYLINKRLAQMPASDDLWEINSTTMGASLDQKTRMKRELGDLTTSDDLWEINSTTMGASLDQKTRINEAGARRLDHCDVMKGHFTTLYSK